MALRVQGATTAARRRGGLGRRGAAGLGLLLAGLAIPAGAQTPAGLPDVAEPRIPARTVDIRDFGAVPDGRTLNTAAIAGAIAECSRLGGGRVVIPRGLWLTGPIALRSRIDLHLAAGALLVFSGDFRQYPVVASDYEGSAGFRCQAPLSGRSLEDVAITGRGVIDGSGQAWRPVKKSKLTAAQWAELLASGGVLDPPGEIWFPSAAARDGARMLADLWRAGQTPASEDYERVRQALRPVMLSLVECRRVLLDGPTFQNSPAWNLHPLMCEDLTIRNVSVRNPWYSQNGDGVDLDSCRNVIVKDSTFDVGDDAICLKSGRDAAGRRRGRPTENVRIADCVVYHGHGGVVVGSEMSGGVRNVDVRGCTFIGTDTGLRFKSRRGRGGVVEKIRVRNVLMRDIAREAITFSMFYGGQGPTEAEDAEDQPQASEVAVSEETPVFRDIVISDVIVRGARRAVQMDGLPEMPLGDLELRNVSISAERGLIGRDLAGLRLREVEIVPRTGPVLALANARDVVIENARCPEGADPFLRLRGRRTRDVAIVGTDLGLARRDLDLGADLPPGFAVGRR